MSHDPIIEPSALSSLPTFRLLDVRDPAAFSSSHATNAVRVPVEVWEEAGKAGETSFENFAYWGRAISELGVDGGVPAVVYDDGRMTEAARVWFILQFFGAKAFILNGGWPAIEGRDDLVGAPRSTGASFSVRPGAGAVGLIDRQTLKASLDTDIRIFDARTTDEFTGKDLRRNARGGHLPGARLLPHARLLNGSRLRPAAELHNLLAQAGFRPGDHVITHCDGGGRAALAAAAAARAGYENVRAYYLSFADWAKDESCAIVRD
ncbi:sulfurtransferase [Sinorhizobium meliloti]|uniref:sulfurtransferase n=1 Tax=Rhizobium meliloti TaxID=382 RepID=UPI000FD6FEDC|nr:rhodanese-like domain-containing protein [Sinorhizobium meliloti]RVJ49362.1 rhodanese family protein [Sinorhizobium meliloti]